MSNHILCWMLLMAASSLVFFEVSPTASPVSDEMMDVYFRLLDPANVEDFLSNQELYMKSVMNASVNPCSDFYQYACGNWKNFVLTTKQKDSSSTTFYHIHNTIVAKMLDEEHQNDSRTIRKSRDFYKSCLDSTNWNFQEIQDLLAEIGPWPVTDSNWSSLSYNFPDTLGRVHQYGIFLFFKFSKRRPLKTTKSLEMRTRHMFLIDGVTSQIAFDFMVSRGNASTKEDYVRFIKDMFSEMLITTVLEQDTMLEKVFEFERKFHRLRKKSKNGSSGSLKLSEVLQFMLLPKDVLDELDLNENSTVYSQNIAYLRSIFELLEATDVEVLASYMFVNIALKYYLLSKAFSAKNLRQNCAGLTKKHFSPAIVQFYNRRYYDTQTQKVLESMIEKIRASAETAIDESMWIDDDTKLKILHRFRRIKERIGYPVSYNSPWRLHSEYEDLSIDSGNFFKNLINIERRLVRIKPDQYPEWAIDVLSVSATFSPWEFAIEIPLGIIQPPFFHKHSPEFINYGNLGMIIGHELMHSMDAGGIEYNDNGEKKRWFGDEFYTKFNTRMECFKNRHEAIYGKKFNTTANVGAKVLAESLADFQGFQVVLDAFERCLKDNQCSSNGFIDAEGRHLTSVQALILNFAQLWCGFIPEKQHSRHNRNSIHATASFRVYEALSNSPDFQQMFRCSEESPMNSGEKCEYLRIQGA